MRKIYDNETAELTYFTETFLYIFKGDLFSVFRLHKGI